jgi:hypothetical protein
MKLSDSQFRIMLIYFFFVWGILTFLWAYFILSTGLRIDSMAFISILHLLAGIFSFAFRKSM